MNLEAKFKTYLALLPSQQDANGFIVPTTGDSLLFTSLAGCVQGVEVDIDAARMGDIWFRHPLQYPPATSTGFSRTIWQRIKDCLNLKTTNVAALRAEFTRGNSTISRDMLTGLLWFCYFNKRQDLAEHVVQYALKHWGVMGKGDPSKVNIMPGLLATAAWVSYKLGGPSRWWLRWIPADFGGTPADYQAHLQVLHIMLRKTLMGKSNWIYDTALQEQVTREPNNPLFQLAIGNDGMAEYLLGNESLWPSDRLPTTADRSEAWLPQRDHGKDWQPDLTVQPPRTHHGADYLFLYALMENRLK